MRINCKIFSFHNNWICSYFIFFIVAFKQVLSIIMDQEVGPKVFSFGNKTNYPKIASPFFWIVRIILEEAVFDPLFIRILRAWGQNFKSFDPRPLLCIGWIPIFLYPETFQIKKIWLGSILFFKQNSGAVSKIVSRDCRMICFRSNFPFLIHHMVS